MNCGDCKYLGSEITIERWPEGEPAEIPTGFYQCEKIKHIGMDGEDLEGVPDLAVAVDGSGYMGAIRVRADFGCVNFEDKNSA